MYCNTPELLPLLKLIFWSVTPGCVLKGTRLWLAESIEFYIHLLLEVPRPPDLAGSWGTGDVRELFPLLKPIFWSVTPRSVLKETRLWLAESIKFYIRLLLEVPRPPGLAGPWGTGDVRELLFPLLKLIFWSVTPGSVLKETRPFVRVYMNIKLTLRSASASRFNRFLRYWRCQMLAMTNSAIKASSRLGSWL